MISTEINWDAHRPTQSSRWFAAWSANSIGANGEMRRAHAIDHPNPTGAQGNYPYIVCWPGREGYYIVAAPLIEDQAVVLVAHPFSTLVEAKAAFLMLTEQRPA